MRPANADLRRDGTYMVFRKLEQDVVAFRRYLGEHGGATGRESVLAAQMMGRWPDGTSLVKSAHWPTGAATIAPSTTSATAPTTRAACAVRSVPMSGASTRVTATTVTRRGGTASGGGPSPTAISCLTTRPGTASRAACCSWP